MGIFDILRGQKDDVATTRSALDQANDPTADDSAITRLIENIIRRRHRAQRPCPRPR